MILFSLGTSFSLKYAITSVELLSVEILSNKYLTFLFLAKDAKTLHRKQGKTFDDTELLIFKFLILHIKIRIP